MCFCIFCFLPAGFFVAAHSFFITMVNNTVPCPTLNSLAAGFMLSSSSQSTPMSSANSAAIMPSVANVSQVATSAASAMVVSSSMASPLLSPNALAAAVAQAIENMLPAIVLALQSSNSQPVSTTPSSVPVSNPGKCAASSAPPPSSRAQAGVFDLASSAGRLQVPSFIPMFSPLPATSLPSSVSLVASSMSATGCCFSLFVLSIWWLCVPAGLV